MTIFINYLYRLMHAALCLTATI